MVYFDEIAVNYECCLTIKATFIRIAVYCKTHCYDMGILMALLKNNYKSESPKCVYLLHLKGHTYI